MTKGGGIIQGRKKVFTGKKEMMRVLQAQAQSLFFFFFSFCSYCGTPLCGVCLSFAEALGSDVKRKTACTKGDQRSWERASRLDRRGSVIGSTTPRSPSTINRPEMKIEADALFYKPLDRENQSLKMSESVRGANRQVKRSGGSRCLQLLYVKKLLVIPHSTSSA
jgi:hypothetical protein